jgi:hypothetical protein
MQRQVEPGSQSRLFLVCERCRVSVDLKLTDPNP